MLILVPRVGVLWAVMLETPVILTASWIVCGWVLRRWAVSACTGRRLTMGGVAFVLLLLAEALLALVIGLGPTAYFASWGTAPGALGLAGQLVFAFFPLARMRASES